MIWPQLYLERSGAELAVRITFSNLCYASDDEPRGEKSFDFRFPGVQFDPAVGTFLARSSDAEIDSSRAVSETIRFVTGLIWRRVRRSVC
jgi:hypothetical protein